MLCCYLLLWSNRGFKSRYSLFAHPIPCTLHVHAKICQTPTPRSLRTTGRRREDLRHAKSIRLPTGEPRGPAQGARPGSRRPPRAKDTGDPPEKTRRTTDGTEGALNSSRTDTGRWFPRPRRHIRRVRMTGRLRGNHHHRKHNCCSMFRVSTPCSVCCAVRGDDEKTAFQFACDSQTHSM